MPSERKCKELSENTLEVMLSSIKNTGDFCKIIEIPKISLSFYLYVTIGVSSQSMVKFELSSDNISST